MRYCQIVPSLEERHGGPSKSALGLATALAAAGHETDLLATDPRSDWSRAEGGLDVRVFRRSTLKSFACSSGLAGYLKRDQADVVHHHSIWLRTLHYAHQAADRMGARFVVSPRGMMNPWAWNHHARRKRFARNFIHPGAFEAVHGWHATSEEEAGAIRALGFRNPICVAPNGVDIPAPELIAEGAAHWKDLIGGPRGQPIGLFYSRFHRKKRVIELIDCWLENTPADWLLVVAGIPEEYSVREIENYVLRTGGVGRVLAYDGAGRPPPYGAASLFVLPSHSENFGLSIAEALAHGVPAIVTDTTPWAELNRNGAGWCVPWSEFATTLRAATAESEESLRHRGAVGREWMGRDYSWGRWAKVLSEFYGTLKSG
jgi:glycosyltransferase involved in cell wall biosynthesis